VAARRQAQPPADPGARIRDYLAAQPPLARRRLRALHAAIRAAAPGATEVFSYGIPGFRLDGKAFIWYAGFTAHFSLYPMGEAIRRAFAAELKSCETSKGTIRFSFDRPPSAALVKRLVRARAAELRGSSGGTGTSRARSRKQK